MMQIFDISQITQFNKRVVAMAGTSFFNRVTRIGGLLTVFIAIFALAGCGEGDGPTRTPGLSLIHISEPTRPVGISRMPSSA